MRIVVAGAAGFLGSHVVAEAVRHDVDVVALIPPQADPAWFSELGAIPTPLDTSDADALRGTLPGLLAGAAFLINAPALLADGYSVPAYRAANIDVTTALLDAALQVRAAQDDAGPDDAGEGGAGPDDAGEGGAGPGLRGVVQLSSTLSYGYALPHWAVDESWAARPPSPAIQSLEDAERAARTYRRRIPLLVLRAAPTFGPRDDGVIQRLLIHFGRARRPRLAAGGRAPISLVYGPDFGRAAWAALQAFEETQGRILHVKSIDSDWRTIVAQARAINGRSGGGRPLPLWLARRLARTGPVGRRLLDAPAGVPDYPDLIGRPHVIDDTPLRALTGFAPLFGLRAALTHTIALQAQGPSTLEPLQQP